MRTLIIVKLAETIGIGCALGRVVYAASGHQKAGVKPIRAQCNSIDIGSSKKKLNNSTAEVLYNLMLNISINAVRNKKVIKMIHFSCHIIFSSVKFYTLQRKVSYNFRISHKNPSFWIVASFFYFLLLCRFVLLEIKFWKVDTKLNVPILTTILPLNDSTKNFVFHRYIIGRHSVQIFRKTFQYRIIFNDATHKYWWR